MHDHIKNIVEELLNMMSESLSLYKSINVAELHGMGPATLDSIIQSKENSLEDLLKEFNKIYPNFKPKQFPMTSQPINTNYKTMLSLEDRITTYVQNNLFPNIPSKGHEGIYTLAANIRSNSESTVVKLNNMLNIRQRYSSVEINIIKTLLPIVICLENYEKLQLEPQVALCKELLEQNKRLLQTTCSKVLTIYEPKYGESLSSIASNFEIKLSDLITLNRIRNPYAKISSKYLIIISN